MSADHALETTESDHFVVHVTRNKNAELRVSSVELMQPDLRNRYSFRTPRALHELFVKELADALDAALKRFERGARILSMPDFTVQLPGLVLGGLRLLATRLEDGTDVIMVRVREYVGSIKLAFRFDHAMALESSSVRERIAVEVLKDIVNPLLDILSIAKEAPPEVLRSNSDALNRQLRRMGSRQEELSFYTGMLQRYIAGCREDAENSRLPGPTENKPLFNGH
jgi:hypothetical protein